ncbi:hypothetical protein [Nocardioides sp. SYSU D00038]|uniref:hypothetical protein n=1 Tax=Nocardioides sp. SYSU D00038 TaxID=2812554 RepID=UPI00196770B1|nr:hypothetical protein [Nocardioides sp. SYSU D00038]
MGWEEELFTLFEDLEHQAGALWAAEAAPELADRSRTEYRSVTLASRLMAAVDGEVTVEVAGVGTLTGRLDRVASGWLLLSVADQDWVVVERAVVSAVVGTDRAVPEVAWPAVASLGVSSVLRRLADAGERCVLRSRSGHEVTGVPHRVGADFVEVLAGEPARSVLVGLGDLAAVQSRR